MSYDLQKTMIAKEINAQDMNKTLLLTAPD